MSQFDSCQWSLTHMTTTRRGQLQSQNFKVSTETDFVQQMVIDADGSKSGRNFGLSLLLHCHLGSFCHVS